MRKVNKLTQKDINNLLKNPSNKYLKKTAEEKYAEFKEYDPFPLVPDALLNSVDIIKYVYTTGMIYPFNPESLEGAVYTCNFSGYYKYWDNDFISHEETLDDSGELKLRPNSISFLGIEPIFRIPTYLILRFNLKVQHVYKGLLLGTGPIVDPGFSGQLFIPLHNLTSNEYIIKKNAPLICIEITKLSKNNYRNLKDEQKTIINSLDFSSIPIIINSIEPLRDFNFYLKKALINKMFRKSKTDQQSVGSSIPEAITRAQKSAKQAEDNVNEMRSFIYKVASIAITVTILTIGALVIGIFSLIDGVNARIDNIANNYYKIMQENKKIQEDNKDLKNMLIDLQSELINIQKTNKNKETIIESPKGK
jgi:deoxycytidine triphosphate deaminase